MAFHMLIALQVEDHEAYAEYRREMRPMLEAMGGGFPYDFAVARTWEPAEGKELNRVFVIAFPDRETRDQFFADARYLEIRERLFERAVKQVRTLAEY